MIIVVTKKLVYSSPPLHACIYLNLLKVCNGYKNYVLRIIISTVGRSVLTGDQRYESIIFWW